MSARLAFLFALVLALVTAPALGRPGGGSSYKSGSSGGGSSSKSGGSSSKSGGSSTKSGSTGSGTGSGSKSTGSGTSSGSGSSGDDDTPRAAAPPASSDGAGSPPPRTSDPPILFTLFFFVLVLGTPIVVLVLIVRAIGGFFRRRWDTGTTAVPDEPRFVTSKLRDIEEALASLRATDRAFSRVLFEDFVHALYAETQRRRGDLSVLAGYLSADARRAYDAFPVDGVRDVVIGAFRIVEVVTDPAARTVRAILEIEANHTELRDGAEAAHWVAETWTLVRSADAKSRDPEAATAITCPHCGAPLEQTVGGTCTYCKHTSTQGADHWFVESIRLDGREARGPMLTGTTEEVGTDLPTVVAADANRRWRELSSRDQTLTWEGLSRRVWEVFTAFYRGWSARDLSGVRPYLSDALFSTQSYWVRTYLEQHLRNVADDASITSMQLARVLSDAFYDAVTVRVYAECKDYTLDDAGRVVAGNRDRKRIYSEYWTFIRGRSPKGPAGGEAACPSCGAPLDVDVAGSCKHCRAKLTRGDFDWVLSRIEQDEAYEG